MIDNIRDYTEVQVRSLLRLRKWKLAYNDFTGEYKAKNEVWGETGPFSSVYTLFNFCENLAGAFEEKKVKDMGERKFRSECMYGGQLTPWGGWPDEK